MGRPKRDLTETEKQFITDNYKTMTYLEMMYELGLKSTFAVQRFCNRSGFVKVEPGASLTKEQEEFIRNNLQMPEKEISSRLNVPFHLIPKFKRIEGLSKPHVKVIEIGEFFNVDAMECWAI